PGIVVAVSVFSAHDKPSLQVQSSRFKVREEDFSILHSAFIIPHFLSSLPTDRYTNCHALEQSVPRVQRRQSAPSRAVGAAHPTHGQWYRDRQTCHARG